MAEIIYVFLFLVYMTFGDPDPIVNDTPKVEPNNDDHQFV